MACLLGFALLAASIQEARATLIFSAPTTITNVSEVATNGTTAFAVNFASTENPVVNGITFNGVTPSGSTLTLPGGYGSISASSPAHTIDHNATAFTSGSNPYNALPAAYKSLLQSSIWYPNTPGDKTFTINLQNLSIDRVYLVQLWVNDPRSSGVGRITSVQGNNSITLDHNSTGAVGSPGEFTIGTFTATATNMSFTATGGGNGQPQFNAMQLRDLGVIPEPGVIGLLGLGAGILATVAKRKRALS